MKPKIKILLRLAFVYGALFGVPSEGFGLQTYGIIGDAGYYNENHAQVLRSLAKAKVFNLILPGDNLYELNPSYERVWNPWRDKGFKFSVVAIGNHNLGYKEEMRYFGLAAEYFSRTEGNARFIVLNSDNEATAGIQLRFLESELASATETFVFIVFHHPPFTISERHTWREKKIFQLGIRKMLLRFSKRISGLIVGHDHIASLVAIGDIPMIVSGANFDHIPTRPRIYDEGPFEIRTQWLFRNGPHWVRLDLDDEKAWVNYVRARDGEVLCSAKIYPRPIELRSSCRTTTTRALPVFTDDAPEATGRSPK